MAESHPTPPHLHGPDTTQLRMLDAAIALLPVAAGALWFFRLQALVLLALSVGCCVGLELLFLRLWRRSGSIGDGAAVVTGLLLALLLPAGCPWWAVPVASAVAVVGCKALFGGLGKNLLNPAAAGCAVLLLVPGLQPAPLRTAAGHFLMGYTQGSLGEVSSLLLLVGAAYLALRRLLPVLACLSYVSAAFLTGALLPGCDPVAVVAWGGTLLCGGFLQADPVTTPMTSAGRAAFGAGAGVLCTLGAYHGFGLPGAACGILAMNVAYGSAVALRRWGIRRELVKKP